MHLAAESHVDRSIKGPREFIESNIIGTFNILEATRKHYEKLSNERKKKIFNFIDDLLQKTGKIGEYDQKI